eukprot:TRINITY_DN10235_c0_g1_i1.p1 TRINITY_DN10235_c0_g1~~TRINITY_DN10235_c0_g1_i1.p1  ORF type:complete len:1064 (+),score=229.29 TRINITY_DN10235_c0_g1_i1:285-3476(+)
MESNRSRTGQLERPSSAVRTMADLNSLFYEGSQLENENEATTDPVNAIIPDQDQVVTEPNMNDEIIGRERSSSEWTHSSFSRAKPVLLLGTQRATLSFHEMMYSFVVFFRDTVSYEEISITGSSTILDLKNMICERFEETLSVELEPQKHFLELSDTGLYLTKEYESISSLGWQSDKEEYLSLQTKKEYAYHRQYLMKIQVMLGDSLPPITPHNSDDMHFRKTMYRNILPSKRRKKYFEAFEAQTEIYEQCNFMVRVHKDDITKTIRCNVDTTAIELIENITKFNNIDINAEDHLLRIAGYRLFINPHTVLIKISQILNNIERNKITELIIISRDELDYNDFVPELDHSWNEKLAIIQGERFNIPSRSIPHYSVNMEFTFFLEYLEFSTINDVSSSDQFYISAQLYFSGIEIGNEMKTAKKPFKDLNWNQLLTTGIDINNIPKETILQISLIRDKCGKTKCEFFTDLNIYDHSQYLVSGRRELYLWKGEGYPLIPSGRNYLGMKKRNNILYVTFNENGIQYQEQVISPRSEHTSHEIPSPIVMNDLIKILNTDPWWRPDKFQKGIIWKYRNYILDIGIGLDKIILTIDWSNNNQVREFHRIINSWQPLDPAEAIIFLDAKYTDSKVREFALNCMKDMSDAELETYLLQLIQTVKYENHHYSKLAHFLIERACQNDIQIGIPLFWYLISELDDKKSAERFSLLMEAYLVKTNSDQREELFSQLQMANTLSEISINMRPISKSKRREELQHLLTGIELPERITLPQDPTSMGAVGLQIEKCFSLDSAKAPLFLYFDSVDPYGPEIQVIFKDGDDLRQDVLSLQMLKIMDHIWKEQGLNLHLTPYKVISTGFQSGFIQVVKDSKTVAAIQKDSSGWKGAFSAKPIDNWLRSHNPREEDYERVVNNFAASCAGYCVATYILGIGDRHNDNMMIDEHGHFFHIDFGHFLGHYKTFAGIQRETSPFILTKEFAYVMGGQNGEVFAKFCEMSCRAFNIIRKKADLIINLFAMMISTGIPELRSESLKYLRDSLSVSLSDDEAAEKFLSLIDISLNDKRTNLNFAVHILAH